jgi:hypothetical protein
LRLRAASRRAIGRAWTSSSSGAVEVEVVDHVNEEQGCPVNSVLARTFSQQRHGPDRSPSNSNCQAAARPLRPLNLVFCNIWPLLPDSQNCSCMAPSTRSSSHTSSVSKRAFVIHRSPKITYRRGRLSPDHEIFASKSNISFACSSSTLRICSTSTRVVGSSLPSQRTISE